MTDVAHHEESRLEFGEFTFDLAAMRLYKGEVQVHLPPQPLKLLSLLARSGGRLVGKEEIRDHLWPDQIVEFDQSLGHCLRKVREALGDDARTPTYVETVPRLGYRFLPAVVSTPAHAGVAPDAQPDAHTPRRRGVTLVLVVTVLVTTAIGSLWLALRDSDRPDPPPALPVADRDAEAVGVYNVATELSREGRLEEALATLARSAELGFRFPTTLTADADLDPLRGLPGFAAVAESIASNSRASLRSFADRLAGADLLVLKPEGVSAQVELPLVVGLHTLGGSAQSAAELYRPLVEELGVAVALPQSLAEAGGGYAWRVVEESELLVLDAVERVRSTHSIDAGRIVVSGLSQGGTLAWILGSRQPHLFAGVVPVAGDWDARRAPPPRFSARAPRYFVLCHRGDPSFASNQRAVEAWRAAGLTIEAAFSSGEVSVPPRELALELGSAIRWVLEGTDVAG